ncbi:CST complex subunit STN1-like [Zingiber officinale]|uniref:CST complex subunit STN1-like n=1 Tax=Zingiber officinale TaxID=94328 RepID=UPI001C4B1A45|nr:CST complex subunit STN1-like [Zingiber officinale]
MNWFQAIHVKLLATDFLSLTVHNPPNYAPTFLRRGMKVWRVETVGVVVSKERTGDYLKFFVDDGTGCIPCILDVTDRSHLGLAAEVETEIALREAATVELGKLVRVRGMIMLGEEDGLHLKVRDVVVERDPNMEALHWMDCIRLARTCYDRVARPKTPALALPSYDMQASMTVSIVSC